MSLAVFFDANQNLKEVTDLHANLDFGIDLTLDAGFTLGLAGSYFIESLIDNKFVPYAYIGWMF